MTMQKIRLGNKEDGSPMYLYNCPDGSVVIPGPITGDVTTKDGTTYNVSDDVVEVPADHVDEVAHEIALRYVDEGHPSHNDPEAPFVYVDDPATSDAGTDADVASVTSKKGDK